MGHLFIFTPIELPPRTWAHDGIEPLHIDESVQFNEGMALQKDSEFTALFNHHIFELLQTGVVDRIRHEWMDRADGDFWVVEAVTLGYENVLFPFVSVVVGSLFAFLFALCELFTRHVAAVWKLEVTRSGRIHVVKTRQKVRLRVGKYLVKRKIDPVERE